jgi:2-polyprenyl-6-hydroxyphenyl methylase/3-demethylubiquinone-9 3-methyltransferase
MATAPALSKGSVNNEIYHELGERWYTANDDPIALLRAESRARNPWIAAEIERAFGLSAQVLDVGCGGGFLSNDLARRGLAVTGIDASAQSLAIARAYDSTGKVRYELGDAYQLPYADASFHAACAMDFLEHVEQPARVIAECARVLQPNGLFFFATFNRNPLAWLIGIKGVEWFVNNTPPRLHQLRYFIKPRELQAMCEGAGLQVTAMQGFQAKLNRAFVRMLLTGEVGDDFTFQFGGPKWMGYIGVANRCQFVSRWNG